MKRTLMLSLKRKLSELKRLFDNDPRVLGVWLFGSQANGTATPRSDIDLGVLFDRELTLNEQLAFEVAVSEVLGREDIDVVDLQAASPLLRSRIIIGKLIYARDEVRVADFVERTLIEYPDYAISLGRFNEDYFAGMRQDYARFRRRANQ